MSKQPNTSIYGDVKRVKPPKRSIYQSAPVPPATSDEFHQYELTKLYQPCGGGRRVIRKRLGE